MLVAASKFLRQIMPPVIATLVAAALIAAYNKTFSGHLSQPRMSGLHTDAGQPPAAPITTIGMTTPPRGPVTEIITIHERAIEPERLAAKDASREAGKDQAPIKLAEPAPVRTASAPKSEPRQEPRRVASVEHAGPVEPVIIAAPPVAQQPPPVIVAAPVGAMVTVPDRAAARPALPPVDERQAERPAPQSPLGLIVNTLSPSALLARAREFGEKIEQAGNDILPSIRQ